MLSKAEREQLTALALRSKTAQALALRARIVLTLPKALTTRWWRAGSSRQQVQVTGPTVAFFLARPATGGLPPGDAFSRVLLCGPWVACWRRLSLVNRMVDVTVSRLVLRSLPKRGQRSVIARWWTLLLAVSLSV